MNQLFGAAPVDEERDLELVVLSVLIGVGLAVLGAGTFYVALWFLTHPIRLPLVAAVVSGFALMAYAFVRIRKAR